MKAKTTINGIGFSGKNRIGDRVKRLVIVALDRNEKKDRGSRAYWKCRCDCGKIVITRWDCMTSGNTTSCGCLKDENARKRCWKHGHAGTFDGRASSSPIYKSYCSMWDRCTNPKTKHWDRYGGRGISVCERWREFSNFLSDMGDSWRAGLTIERKDNDGNYDPGNCRWATKKEQNFNTSRNHRITFQGRTLTMTEWAQELGMGYATLSERLHRLGWSDFKALSTPVKKYRPRA